MLLDHLTSEQPIAVSARGRTVDEWNLLPGRENHLFDCAVMATVTASAAGITAVGAEPSPERQRRWPPRRPKNSPRQSAARPNTLPRKWCVRFHCQPLKGSVGRS